MAGYFSYFPNVYIAEGVSDDEAFKFRLTKNIFRKIAVRPDLDQYTTLFEAYSIEPGETPSNLAYKLFDDIDLDWAIILINEITDVYEQWPKDPSHLESYIYEKYQDNVDDIHHWETNEQLMTDGTVFIKRGIEVTETFRSDIPGIGVQTKEASIYPVTNYENEYFLNEQKRQIQIPTGNVIDLMIEQFEDLVSYEPHVELDDENNKKTPINIVGRFLNNVGSPTYASQRIFSRSDESTTFDDGPAANSIGSVGIAGTSTNVVSITTTSSSSGGTGSSSSSSSSSSSPSSGSSSGYGY